jgi:hypothetical protein
MHRHSLLLLSLCITALVMSPLGVAGTRTEGTRGTAATLRKVSSSLDTRIGLLTIEASAPVPYVASQPDAHTTLVEMRDVEARGVADRIKIDQRHPVDAVKVESAVGPDGVSLARVRITFRQPVRPRIRSSRNSIFVEADRVDSSTGLVAGATVAGPRLETFSPTIRDVRITQRGTATAVTLLGTGPLVASNVQEPTDGPRRIVVTLPNATSAVPGTTSVRGGPVERMRIAMSAAAPFGTQVTMELSRAASYRLERSTDGNDLSVVFDEQMADPIAALRAPTAVPFAAQAAAPPPPPVAPQAAPGVPVEAAPRRRHQRHHRPARTGFGDHEDHERPVGRGLRHDRHLLRRGLCGQGQHRQGCTARGPR